MTPTTPAGLPAVPEDLETGLEDFDNATDAVMPRLSIVGPEAVFKDNLSGQKHERLTVILLGLVKGRILWDDDVEEGEQPLCKSLDFHTGYPDLARFPLAESQFPAIAPTLPCEQCNLKEWGTASNGKTPWCSEQHTYPLLMQVGDGPDDWAPALFTVQRTGIKPSRSYVTSFARTKTPLYTTTTELTLTGLKKGSVHYAVPNFVKGKPTPPEQWPYYAQTYRGIRDFLQTPREVEEKTDATETPEAGGAEPAAPITVPATISVPVPADDEEDMPF